MRSELVSALWLIALSVATSVTGQTAIKLGLRQVGAVSLTLSNPLAVVTTVLRSPLVLLGLALYGVGALAWIAVLSRLDLSYAYPFVALNLVLVTVVSRAFLHEAVPGLRWLGLAAICAGVALVARSSAG